MYVTRDHEAKQIVVTKVTELYVKLLTFARILHKVAREVEDFAIDLIKI